MVQTEISVARDSLKLLDEKLQDFIRNDREYDEFVRSYSKYGRGFYRGVEYSRCDANTVDSILCGDGSELVYRREELIEAVNDLCIILGGRFDDTERT